jgi:hypothetical protein
VEINFVVTPSVWKSGHFNVAILRVTSIFFGEGDSFLEHIRGKPNLPEVALFNRWLSIRPIH